MKLTALIRSVMNGVLHRSHLEADMNDELRFHIEAHADTLAHRYGISRDEALRRARIEFGSVEKYKEEGRAGRGLRLLDELSGDVRYALRQFRSSPVFTAVAILTLAIGIGVNTAAFTRLNEALWKPLPVPHPEQLQKLEWASEHPGFRTNGNSSSPRREGYNGSFSYPAYQYMRDHATLFSDVFCFDSFAPNLNLGIQGRAESAATLAVSGNYFRGLGIEPSVGRNIVAADDQPGAAPVIMLSYGFWQRAFGSDPKVVGRSVILNGTAVDIIGVAKREPHAAIPAIRPDIVVSMSMLPLVYPGRKLLENPRYWSFNVVGRMRSGITEEQARTESEGLLRQAILAEPPKTWDPPRVALAPGAMGFNAPGFELNLPMVAAALVLLIACANIAGLLLSRANARRREFSSRLALGASRARLVRQLMTESLILSFAGGTLGLAVAWLASDVLSAPDFREIAFFFGVTLFAGIAFGLVPALRATRLNLLSALKQTTLNSIGDRSQFRTGKVLVSVQVALSLMLVVGAALFLQTLSKLRSQDMGFEPENLLTFRINPSLNGYKGEAVTDLYEELMTQFRSLPGVRGAAISRWGVLTQGASGEMLQLPGKEPRSVATAYVSGRYFETMGIPMVAGRPIESGDRSGASMVAVVNEAFVKRFFPDTRPLGQKMNLNETGDVEIVGIVRDAKYGSVQRNKPSTVYLSYQQSGESRMTFAVRTTGDTASVLPSIRQTLARLDGNLPMYDVHTQREWIELGVSREGQVADLLLFYGSIALLLASIGIYGTLAYTVTRRTSEIGIRMALGAQRVEVMRMVVTGSLIPVSIGIVMGLVAYFSLMSRIRSLLFGVSPTDPLTIAGATLVLFITAAVAAWLPARRAALIDPMVALRYE